MSQQTFKLDQLEIGKASIETGSKILDLLKSRAMDLRDKGSQQWSFLLTGQEDAELLDLVSRGYFYKVSQTTPQKIAATFMLSDKQEEWDIHLWGREDTIGTIYLHKLAVALEYKGEGLGDLLMDWIKQHVQELGYTKIRLDCVADSEKLRDFYEKHGFMLVKIADEHGLYEWEPENT